MFMKMVVYLFDHFVIIRKVSMLAHSFVELRMQQGVSKQHPYNSNHVSSKKEKRRIDSIEFHCCCRFCSWSKPLVFFLLLFLYLIDLWKRCAPKAKLTCASKKQKETFLKFHLPPYCNLIESSPSLQADCLKGNVNIIIICFIVYARRAYGWS